MTLTAVVSLLLLILLTGIAALWYWYERRGLSQYEPLRNRAIYICIRCGKVYRGARNKDLVECPDCHYNNLPLHF
jgi:hypothetical protein